MDLAQQIFIMGSQLHGSRGPLHMHEADRNLRLGRCRQGTRSLQGANIIDQMSTGCHGGRHDLGLVGIDRDPDIQLSG